MKHRLLTWADNLAHFLYCPTMLGARAARARWHHRVHLIPGSLLARACDALDRDLGVTEDEMHLRRPTRVPIDPNIRVGRDRTLVGIEDPEFPVSVGEEVEVYTGDWLTGTAVVYDVDEERRLIYLRLDWSSLRVGSATSTGHLTCPDGCTTLSVHGGSVRYGRSLCGEPMHARRRP